MQELRKIIEYGMSQWGNTPETFTDKETALGHRYIDLYEYLMSANKDRISLLEIGIRSGGSLWLWKNYFKNYSIYGIDISSEFCLSRPFQESILFDNNINLLWNKDSRDPNTYKNLPNFDFIIDDGDHTPNSQLQTLYASYSKLNSKGIYVIEDVDNVNLVIPMIAAIRSLDSKAIINTYYGNTTEKHDDIIIWIVKS